MTPLQYALVTFAFTLGWMGAVYLLLRSTAPAPSDQALARSLAGPAKPWITKEAAECCRSKALDDGRPVIGYCGPDCERRPK